MRLHASNGVHQAGDGVGFDANGVAYDLDTMAVKFSPLVAGTFITSLGGGGVALTDGITLTELDDTGAVVREAPMPVIPAPSAARMMLFEGAGTTPSYGGGDLWIAVVAERLERYEGTGLAANTDEYPDRNGTRQPDKKFYSTPELAAFEFFRKSWTSSHKEQREYGGKLCMKSSTQFTTSPPVKGPVCSIDQCTVNPDLASCPMGTSIFSEYHTHPKRFLSSPFNPDGPSDDDKSRLESQYRVGNWWTSYVGTWCGRTWSYRIVEVNGLVYTDARPVSTLPLFWTGFDVLPGCVLPRTPAQ